MRSTVFSVLKLLVVFALISWCMPPDAFGQTDEPEIKAPPKAGNSGMSLKKSNKPRSTADIMKEKAKAKGKKGEIDKSPAPTASPRGMLKMPSFKSGPGNLNNAQGDSNRQNRITAKPSRGDKMPPHKPGMGSKLGKPKAVIEGKDKSSQGEKSPSEAGDAEKKYAEFQRGEKYRIDYYDQDLLEFIKLMSEKFKVNFIISDKIKGGKITIVSPNPVSREEAWQAFLSAMESKGLTIVRVGRFYKIIQIKEANNHPIKTYLEGGETSPSDEVITYLYKLQYIDTSEVDKILQKLKSKDGEIFTFEPTGTFIITDTAVNIRRMVKIVNELDAPSGRDSIHVIDIYYAEAQEIADKLQTIFGDKKGSYKSKSKKGGRKGSSSSSSDNSSVSISNIIADERTNQLIVVAPRSAMSKIVDMINRLDVPIPGDGQIHVYYCENANAEDLQSTLTGITGKTSGKSSKKSKKSSKNAGDMFEGEVKVNADKSTNSLVITASTKDFKALKKVIQMLDIRRRQVFVEAVIMEITMKRNDAKGMAFAGGVTIDVGGETIPIFGATTLGTMSPIAIDPTTLSGLAVGLQGPELEGTEGMLGNGLSIPSFGVLLQMLQTDSDANVLSTPHILTTDNEEAEIIVGSNVPFITGSSRDVNNQPVLSIQRQDVALTMKIKPQISESDFVRLEVQQEITELISISETLGPTTTKRSAKSTVIVKDNQTIVIGGLLRDRETSDTEKVPLLGDLPILGRLFRRDKDTTEKTNLLIFLTPHIIKDEHDFRRIFKRKIDERNEFLRRFYGTEDDYEFEVDYAQKVGPIEAMRQKIDEQEEIADKKRKEMEDEIIINEESKSRVYEIGSTEGDQSRTEEVGDSEPDSAQADAPKKEKSSGQEMMDRMFNKPSKESE